MEQSTGTLSATILDRRSSSPLAGARVSCVWRDQRITTLRLDANGKLRVELPEGVYDLIISANGFLSLLLRGIGILGGNDLKLLRALVPGEGQESDADPATAIGGYVLDRLKRPLRDIVVHATGEGHSYTARTDRSGAFILHGVQPAMYDLEFARISHIVKREPLAISNVRSFVRFDTKILQL